MFSSIFPLSIRGIFRDFFEEDGIQWQVCELDAGAAIPDLKQFDALWVMGGPMDVWQEDQYPWLIEEKQAIRRAVDELAMPYVGICLGHQLLAAAFDAEVGPGQAEVGVLPVKRTGAGWQSLFYKGLPELMQTLQWHSAEVKSVPAGFDVLASSDYCQIQALSRGHQVFTMQYHQEILATTVDDWNAIPEYRQELESSLGADAVAELRSDVNARIQEFNASARVIYNNWKSVVFPE